MARWSVFFARNKEKADEQLEASIMTHSLLLQVPVAAAALLSGAYLGSIKRGGHLPVPFPFPPLSSPPHLRLDSLLIPLPLEIGSS